RGTFPHSSSAVRLSQQQEHGMAEAIEQFVILAKTAKGRACAALIQQILADKRVFVFGEVLAAPSVQEASAPWLRWHVCAVFPPSARCPPLACRAAARGHRARAAPAHPRALRLREVQGLRR